MAARGRPSGLPKSGGRKRGTPNKRTAAITEKLEKMGCDPIAGMAEIAMSEESTPELKLAACRELAQYIAPKRKATEVSGPNDQTMIIEVVTGVSRAPDEANQLEE